MTSRRPTGYVEVEITPIEGKSRLIKVKGADFGHEDGEWYRDRDDNQLAATLVYKAFCEGFDLQQTVQIHGGSIIRSNLSVTEIDHRGYGLKGVTIADDALNLHALIPNQNADVD